MLADAGFSDTVLLLDGILAAGLLLVFTLGNGLAWTRDRLGWVIAYYAATVVALFFLIGWAIVFGFKLPEPWRSLIALALGAAIVWKTVAIIRERRAGRPPRHPRRKA